MANISRNRKVVRDAFKILDEVTIPKMFLPMFENIAAALVQDAIVTRTFTSFTGNTLTSITAGVYKNNVLETVISANDSLAPPVRVKIKQGEYVYLEEPYEGLSRSQKGQVPLNPEYGWETSLKFLQGFQFSKAYAYAIVLTTGTEYSEYLEDQYNVLEDTYNNVRSILTANIRSI